MTADLPTAEDEPARNAATEPWPLKIARTPKTKRQLFYRIAPEVVLGIAVALGGGAGYTPAERLPARATAAWKRIEKGKRIKFDVAWTQDGLYPESAIVELCKDRAMLKRSFNDPVDLRDFVVSELLPDGEAPPQSITQPGHRWARLTSFGRERFLSTDERLLSLIGRCAGWADPRVR